MGRGHEAPQATGSGRLGAPTVTQAASGTTGPEPGLARNQGVAGSGTGSGPGPGALAELNLKVSLKGARLPADLRAMCRVGLDQLGPLSNSALAGLPASGGFAAYPANTFGGRPGLWAADSQSARLLGLACGGAGPSLFQVAGGARNSAGQFRLQRSVSGPLAGSQLAHAGSLALPAGSGVQIGGPRPRLGSSHGPGGGREGERVALRKVLRGNAPWTHVPVPVTVRDRDRRP